ncbi:hypothetical protein BDZ97DRAFT_1831438 [Flammula alnicola]|nr:hypothetical protein BDZ97DRAFT_1831438 [Flammula alnicola]
MPTPKREVSAKSLYLSKRAMPTIVIARPNVRIKPAPRRRITLPTTKIVRTDSVVSNIRWILVYEQRLIAILSSFRDSNPPVTGFIDFIASTLSLSITWLIQISTVLSSLCARTQYPYISMTAIGVLYMSSLAITPKFVLAASATVTAVLLDQLETRLTGQYASLQVFVQDELDHLVTSLEDKVPNPKVHREALPDKPIASIPLNTSKEAPKTEGILKSQPVIKIDSKRHRMQPAFDLEGWLLVTNPDAYSLAG